MHRGNGARKRRDGSIRKNRKRRIASQTGEQKEEELRNWLKGNETERGGSRRNQDISKRRILKATCFSPSMDCKHQLNIARPHLGLSNTLTLDF